MQVMMPQQERNSWIQDLEFETFSICSHFRLWCCHMELCIQSVFHATFAKLVLWHWWHMMHNNLKHWTPILFSDSDCHKLETEFWLKAEIAKCFSWFVFFTFQIVAQVQSLWHSLVNANVLAWSWCHWFCFWAMSWLFYEENISEFLLTSDCESGKTCKQDLIVTCFKTNEKIRMCSMFGICWEANSTIHVKQDSPF